jgi:hypothetical protein
MRRPIERAIAALTLALLVLGTGATLAQDKPEKPRPEPAKPRLGLLVNDPKACAGYTLLAPTFSTSTFLIDMEGRVVQTWKSDCNPGQSAYLLENGNLLRTGAVRNPPFFGGGAGGRVQEFTWDGKLIWDYTCSADTYLQHHDVCRLPNGNVVINLWVKKPAKEAIAAGRRPETVTGDDGYVLTDSLIEVKPTDKTSGEIVWEWNVWDHLIQEFDATKANHGDVAAHPELIDLNFGSNTIAAMIAKPEELEKLRAIGYVGAAGRKPQRAQADWLHVNSVTYNADFDQIMLSVHEFNEIWIIDHGTTKAEAAAHTGGKYGKGGDLLYRWGNPASYRAGGVKDQKLFGQHNAHWIAKGLPGEGHVLIFNNGMRRTGGAYSSVDEIVLPGDARGSYDSSPGKPYGPDKAVWSYAAPKRTDFFAGFISGAQRLANGDTLICSGTNGTVFEVSPKDEVVWKYVNPAKNDGPGFGGPPGGRFGGGPPGGGPPGGGAFGGPPKLGQALPSFLRDALNLTAEQKKELEAAEKEIGEKLGKMLTDEQKKQAQERPMGFAPGNFAAPGQLLAAAVVERLKLTEEQKKQLAEIQKDSDSKLDAIFKDEQKKQFKQMQDFARQFAGGPPGGGPPGGGRGGPPGGGPPGGGRGGPPGGFPGGFGGFGGPGGGSGLFRAPRYAPDYAGLVGKELKPGKTIEELQAAPPKAAPNEPEKK